MTTFARRKPACRCHWPIPAGKVDGEETYTCLYCGAALVSLKQLAARKAKQARVKELVQAQEEESDD